MGCCAEGEFEAPDCEDNCEIFDLFVEPYECDDDGNFLIDLVFQISNPGTMGFTLFGNGMNYGNYEYGQIFYTIGPFAGDGTSIYEIVIQDIENPDCQNFITFEAIDCSVPNNVWPGDANADNIANNFDVLNVGIAFGATGEARTLQGNEWMGMAAIDWSSTFENGVNYVHADANGNGIVTADDLEAINLNYNLTHGDVTPFADEEGTENDPPLFVDLPGADLITIGQPFTAPIVLGTDDLPVDDIYGLAFTLVFDPEIINPADAQIIYNDSWMGQNNVNLLTLDKSFATGEVDIVLTKNDQNNVAGFGQIAAFIGIIDNIAGKQDVFIEVKDVRAIKSDESPVLLQRPVEIIEITTSTTLQNANNIIRIFPNPANDELIIANEFQLPVSFCEIRKADGQLVSIFNDSDKKLNISHLSAGLYLLKMEIGGRVYYERFVKI